MGRDQMSRIVLSERIATTLIIALLLRQRNPRQEVRFQGVNEVGNYGGFLRTGPDSVESVITVRTLNDYGAAPTQYALG